MATPIPLTAGFIVVDTTTAKTFQLPLSTDIVGRSITVKDRTGNAGTNNITIQTQGGDTLQGGETSYKITQPYGSVTFVSRVGQWLLQGGTEQLYVSTLNSLHVSTGAIQTSTITIVDILNPELNFGILRNLGGGLEYLSPNIHSFLNQDATNTSQITAKEYSLFAIGTDTYNYLVTAGNLYTSTISSPIVLVNDLLAKVSPLYLSSVFLGNYGGTVYGELTTDSTASDIYWNGSSLTQGGGTGGITTAELVSTVQNFQTDFKTQKISSGLIELSTVNLLDTYTSLVNYLTVSSGTLLLNGGFITGSGGSAVSQLIAGSNISLNPPGGTGAVTINNSINPTGLVSTANLSGLLSTGSILGLVSTPNLSNLISTSFLDTTLVSTVQNLGNFYLSTVPSYLSALTVSTGSLQASTIILVDETNPTTNFGIIQYGLSGLQYLTQNVHSFLNENATNTQAISAKELSLFAIGTDTYSYTLTAGNLYTSTISSPVLIDGPTGTTAPLYLSSVFLGKYDGTIYGQLTTDSTASDIFWNGSSLTQSGVSKDELVSTTGGLQTNFIGQQATLSSLFLNLDPFNAPFWDSNVPIVGFDPEPNPLALDVYGSVRILKSLYIGSTTTKIGTGGIQTANLIVSSLQALSEISTANILASTLSLIDIDTFVPQTLAVSSGIFTLNGQGITGGAGGTPTDWALYPALSTIVLDSLGPKIINPTLFPATFETQTLSIIDSASNYGGVNVGNIVFNTSQNPGIYILENSQFVTGTISTLTLSYFDVNPPFITQNTGSLYLSSIYLGNYGGSVAGELTTDDTATNIYWKGTQLNGAVGAVTTGELVSTVENLAQVGYISTSQLVSTIVEWSRFPAVSPITLFDNDATIINPTPGTGVNLQTAALSVADVNQAPGVLDIGTLNFLTSTSQDIYTIGNDSFFTGTVSSLAIILPKQNETRSLYLSSLYLGNFGGTIYGEITTDETGTNLFWKGTQINGAVGAVTTAELVSTVADFQMDFKTETISSGNIQISTVNLLDIYTNDINFLTVSTGTLLLNGGYITGSGGTAVSQLIAGSGISVSPAGGTGIVTVTNTINTADLVSTANLLNLVSTSYLETQLVSTVAGLSNAGYVIESELFSTVAGLVLPINLISTVAGLSNAGYVIESELFSTTAGLVVPANLVSTVAGLSNAGYVIESELFSTVAGLSNAGYVIESELFSTTAGLILPIDLISTVAGLSNAGYVIESELFSTTAGLVLPINLISTVAGLSNAGYVIESELFSTVAGLSNAGYVIESELFSTTAGLVLPINLISTVAGLSNAGYVVESELFSTTAGLVLPINLISTVAGLSNAGYVIESELFSTVAGLSNAGYVIESELFSTTAGLVVPANLVSTVAGLSNAGYVIESELFSTTAGLVVPINLISTVAGLSNAGYVIESELFSTVAGLSNVGYVVESELFSTTAGLVVPANLVSTVAGLSNAGYVIESELFSTTAGLVLPINLISTVAGLSNAGYVIESELFSTTAGLVVPANLVSTIAGLSNVAVTEIVAGSNITISPIPGIGSVTIHASGGAPSNWSEYPAISSIELYAPNPRIINPSPDIPSVFQTGILILQDEFNTPGNMTAGTVSFATSTFSEIYTIVNDSFLTGTISSLGLAYFDGTTLNSGSFYLSSLYLGNFGGTVAGQLTTDDTATNLYWNGNGISGINAQTLSTVNLYSATLNMSVVFI